MRPRHFSSLQMLSKEGSFRCDLRIAEESADTPSTVAEVEGMVRSTLGVLSAGLSDEDLRLFEKFRAIGSALPDVEERVVLPIAATTLHEEKLQHADERAPSGSACRKISYVSAAGGRGR